MLRYLGYKNQPDLSIIKAPLCVFNPDMLLLHSNVFGIIVILKKEVIGSQMLFRWYCMMNLNSEVIIN